MQSLQHFTRCQLNRSLVYKRKLKFYFRMQCYRFLFNCKTHSVTRLYLFIMQFIILIQVICKIQVISRLIRCCLVFSIEILHSHHRKSNSKLLNNSVDKKYGYFKDKLIRWTRITTYSCTHFVLLTDVSNSFFFANYINTNVQLTLIQTDGNTVYCFRIYS